MQKTYIIVLSLLLVLTTAGKVQTHKPPTLVYGLSHSTTWYAAMGEKDSRIALHFHTKVAPRFLVVGRDHPNSTQILVIFNRTGVNLINVPTKISGTFKAFDEYGDLKPGYYIQVGEYAFEHAAIPNIIIAVGNGLTNLQVTVLKYHPPASTEDSVRQENWKEVGSFAGQTSAYIKGQSVRLPFGSQGLATEYTFVHQKFLETDDLHHH